jgi:hypothetical protein
MGREGKGEGKGREGKGREGKGREGKAVVKAQFLRACAKGEHHVF